MKGKYKVYVIDWKVCYFPSWMSAVERGAQHMKAKWPASFFSVCLTNFFSFGDFLLGTTGSSKPKNVLKI